MIKELVEQVKLNCDISDAQYWGSFSICGLLLRLRDLYRSEQGLNPWFPIGSEDISAWLGEKENRWAAFQGRDYIELTIDGKRYDPFDVSVINGIIEERSLVYGAGYGLYMKPTFFIAQRHSLKKRAGFLIYYSGKEYARDIFASPGMSQGNRIFLRLDPLRTLLWQKFSESGEKKLSCLEEAFSRFNLRLGQTSDALLEEAFEELILGYADVVLHHELAEAIEDVPKWAEILIAMEDRAAEYYLRTLKDLIADTSDHGPLRKLIDSTDREILCLFITSIGSYHDKLYPEMKKSWNAFMSNGDWNVLEETRRLGYVRFISCRERILEAYRISKNKEEFLLTVRQAMCVP